MFEFKHRHENCLVQRIFDRFVEEQSMGDTLLEIYCRIASARYSILVKKRTRKLHNIYPQSDVQICNYLLILTKLDRINQSEWSERWTQFSEYKSRREIGPALCWTSFLIMMVLFQMKIYWESSETIEVALIWLWIKRNPASVLMLKYSWASRFCSMKNFVFKTAMHSVLRSKLNR